MDEQTIEPCPFCRANGESYLGSQSAFVKCENCGAEGPYVATEAEAIRLWNRRAAHSVIAGKVAEQRRALEAIDKTTFIGVTTDSEETRRVALESAHDIARAALAPYPERRHE